MTEAVTESHLSPLNYSERLHQLLYIEEMGQRAALDGFNALLKVFISFFLSISVFVSVFFTVFVTVFASVFVSIFVCVSGPACLQIPSHGLPFQLKHSKIRPTR